MDNGLEQHDLDSVQPNDLDITLDETSIHRRGTPLRDARRSLVQRASATKEAAADQLIAAAERLRVEGLRSGDPEVLRQAQQVARSLERAAVYLHGHTFDQITDDATQVVQAKPWQAVVIAFLVGVIFGRSFRRS